MNLDEIKIQKITKEDLRTLIGWASKEGWNPGKYDIDVFWNTDPDGFYGCKIKNELIAGGAIISYEGEFGFMGLFIVNNQYRSNGVGNKLWHKRKNKLINRLKDNASIGMDGILAMQSYYQKGGFEISFRDERYEIIGKAYTYSQNVSAIESADLKQILEFDKIHFGYQRTLFLQQWLMMPESNAIKYTLENTVVGYAVIRKAEQGYRIGPLFAQDETIAEELLKSCLNFAGEVPVYIDIPTVNLSAMNLVSQYNGKYIFECARMYYGASPTYPIENIYGITTFELG
jgi:N-acetylglutamate synthase-like GNAT family acetyltransferase